MVWLALVQLGLENLICNNSSNWGLIRGWIREAVFRYTFRSHLRIDCNKLQLKELENNTKDIAYNEVGWFKKFHLTFVWNFYEPALIWYTCLRMHEWHSRTN